MGLQLRLIDPRGERAMAFETRTVERPIVVGCGADVDVAVAPLVADVAARHCFFFEYEGQWFVQDARTTGGTFRNGFPVAGPTAVSSGDVVTLGRSAAPASLMVRTVPAASAVAAAPMVAPGEWPVTQALAAAQGSRPETHFYVPGPRRTSPVAITVTVLLSLAIVGGGGMWLRSAYLKREAVMMAPAVVIAPAEQAKPATTRAAATSPARGRSGSTPASAGAATQPATAPEDPRKNEPEWRAVEAARFDEPVLAIVKFNDYLDRFPETPFKADVDRYVDEAVDRVWWQRLVELFEERDLAAKQIDERKGQIRLSQDEEFKKGLENEVEDWTDRQKLADETIHKTMNYPGIGPPNPYDSAALTALRAQRDAAYYEKWKTEVLRVIKRSRGQRLPWKAAR
jgi:hypothetical protein